MKNIMMMVFLLSCFKLQGQTHTEKINKEMRYEINSNDNTLMIANINGHITVEGYSGTSILIEVEKKISAKTQPRLEKGIKEIRLGIIDRADTIIFYTDGLCNKFQRKYHNSKSNGQQWDYNWNDCENNGNLEYDYQLNYKIKVPSHINLILRTINNGNISAEKVAGIVKANNINGSIQLKDLVKGADVHTINGNVDIEYTKNPDTDCKFYTLNGDINALFQRGLAADLTFKSFNGELFSNLDRLDHLPLQVEKSNSKNGIKYSVNTNRYKAGSGGALLNFETFNGNVYIKEKK